MKKSELAAPVVFFCNGHPQIRATHKKTLEFTRDADIGERATCIVGVGATYDLTTLKTLRGKVRVLLRCEAFASEFTATISPFFHDSGALVFRRSAQTRGKTFALDASIGASDLDRGLIHHLQNSTARLEVTLLPLSNPHDTPGVLYAVSLPIGNDDDLSPRAVQVLRSVDLVAAEDTRNAVALLSRLRVRVEVLSYFDHNETSRAPEILQRIRDGARVALVSDAGTPGLSDPGYRLISDAARALIPVIPVPGPSALLAAVVASGLPFDRFAFIGFLSRQAGERLEQLRSFGQLEMTQVFFEAPHRLLDFLNDLNTLAPERSICVARELTKQHEEFVRGTVRDVIEELRNRPAVLGEITVVVGPAPEFQVKDLEMQGDLFDFAAQLAREGVPLQALSKTLTRQLGGSRKSWYQKLLAISIDE